MVVLSTLTAERCWPAKAGRDEFWPLTPPPPGRWSAWLVDERLKPEEPNFPGANGIKFRDGSAWISVSGRWLMLRTTPPPDGRPGPVEPAFTSVLGDAF